MSSQPSSVIGCFIVNKLVEAGVNIPIIISQVSSEDQIRIGLCCKLPNVLRPTIDCILMKRIQEPHLDHPEAPLFGIGDLYPNALGSI